MARMIRAVARLLTGSTYVLLGLDAARAPGGRPQQAAGVLDAVRKVVPLPVEDEVVVRANGAAQMLAGAALATGRAQRFAALTLTGSLIPTTLAGHAYWSLDDPAARKAQRVQFHKNLAMIGGLLFAILDDRRARADHGACSAADGDD